ncbi:transposon Tf2-1 polyprotein isoform X1 [Cucumis melo var. makuwa]|uniref:Transposon Tf2-1 polyprotein isoform X1 n=1 Tax=Cucumis melo var. makuwa TaxID=1194695 RepID=A0A5A7U7R9_CUCMM|nr:transposon Tf2-1 polyprotein isoform X1 [Cucumis melo var. makuwa]TYJ98182.1 transposon Tf2-1 polyprotein isoform X1 [Cucumis melo var. makuwa]
MSDQKALKFLLEQREVQPQFQKWLTKLLGYDFEILYQPGLQNKATDALLRMDMNPELQTMTTTGIVDMETVAREVKKDVELQKTVEQLQRDPPIEGKYKWENGILLYKGRVVLSNSSSLIPSLLHTFHDSILGGHFGFLRTYKRMSRKLYWIGMKNDIKRYVEQCETCQRSKYDATKPAGVLQPIPIPERVLEDWTMDFIEGLPKAEGVNVIMVVVDRLSKYVYFITLKHPFSARYYGPYRITEEIGAVAYRLDLPPEAAIHNVFHISQLKLKLGKQQNVQHQQPILTKDFELQLWPKTVLDIRWNKELGANEWLVKWKGLDDSEATWETVYLMNQQFPTFHLEDKVNLEPRGIVKPPIINVYERKGRKVNSHDSQVEKKD